MAANPNCGIIKNDAEALVVQINPSRKAFDIEIVQRTRVMPKGTVLAFNVNYFWWAKIFNIPISLPWPIGIMWDGTQFRSSIPKFNDKRSCLWFAGDQKRSASISSGNFILSALKDKTLLSPSLAVQAGPVLIRDGKMVPRAISQEEGTYRDDVYRATKHLSVAVLRPDQWGQRKILAMLSYKWTPDQIAEYFDSRGDVTDAMKFDGGSASMLYFSPNPNEKFPQRTWRGNTGLIPTCLVFKEKTL